jgi:hypothetical protein
VFSGIEDGRMDILRVAEVIQICFCCLWFIAIFGDHDTAEE